MCQYVGIHERSDPALHEVVAVLIHCQCKFVERSQRIVRLELVFHLDDGVPISFTCPRQGASQQIVECVDQRHQIVYRVEWVTTVDPRTGVDQVVGDHLRHGVTNYRLGAIEPHQPASTRRINVQQNVARTNVAMNPAERVHFEENVEDMVANVGHCRNLEFVVLRFAQKRLEIAANVFGDHKDFLLLDSVIEDRRNVAHLGRRQRLNDTDLGLDASLRRVRSAPEFGHHPTFSGDPVLHHIGASAEPAVVHVEIASLLAAHFSMEDQVCGDCGRPSCPDEKEKKICGEGNFLEKAKKRLEQLREIKPSRKAYARTVAFLTEWFRVSTWSPPIILLDINDRRPREKRERFRPVILSWLNWDRNNRVSVTLYRAGAPCKVQIQEADKPASSDLTFFCEFTKATDFQNLLKVLNNLVACINPPQAVRSHIDFLLAEDPVANDDLIRLCRESPETGYRLAFLKLASH